CADDVATDALSAGVRRWLAKVSGRTRVVPAREGGIARGADVLDAATRWKEATLARRAWLPTTAILVAGAGLSAVRAPPGAGRRQHMACLGGRPGVTGLSDVQYLEDQVIGVPVSVEIALIAFEGEERDGVIENPVRHARVACLQHARRDRLPRVHQHL